MLQAANEDEMTASHHFACSSFTYCLGLSVTAGSSPTTEVALSDLIGKRLRVPWSSSHLFTLSTQWTLLSVWNPIRQSHTCEPCQRLLWAHAGVCILHASFKTRGQWDFSLRKETMEKVNVKVQMWGSFSIRKYTKTNTSYFYFSMFRSPYFLLQFSPSVDAVLSWFSPCSALVSPGFCPGLDLV